jgi:transposase
MAVEWGRERMELDNIRSLGVDEVLWHKGHKYLTVVYQIDAHCKRLLWIGKERTGKIKFVCSDMWRPYLEVIKKEVKNGLHILDRFHIISHMNKAIDEVRATEVKELKKRGENPLFKKFAMDFFKKTKKFDNVARSKTGSVAQIELKNGTELSFERRFPEILGICLTVLG